jgi:intein-encoded DNA endonuclease-like protein
MSNRGFLWKQRRLKHYYGEDPKVLTKRLFKQGMPYLEIVQKYHEEAGVQIDRVTLCRWVNDWVNPPKKAQVEQPVEVIA